MTRLSLKLLMREWRAGSLTIMLVSLLIAVISHSTIGFFTERLGKAMEAKATHLLGGDLVIKSPKALSPDYFTKSQSLDLINAHTIEFSTVAIAGESLKLTSVKAVSDNYPIKGFLRTTSDVEKTDVITQEAPARGSVWVEFRVLSALNVNINDTIEIGDAQFTISRALTFEPDRGGAFYAFAPRIMMNTNDIPSTNVIQPGSRVDHRYLFVGTHQSITQYKEWLAPKLTPNLKVLDIYSESPAVSNSLRRAESYMNLASLLAILLASVAIAMSARQYAETHYDTSALLRCMGAQQNDVFTIFTIQLSLIALLAALLGTAIGWLTQEGVTFIVRDLLPDSFPPPSLSTLWSAIFMSFVVLFGFSLPTLLRLRKVSPLRVLRNHLEPLSLSGRLIYTMTFALVAVLIYSYTQDARLTASAIVGGSVIGLVGFLLISLLFSGLNSITPRLPLLLKPGIRNLVRRELETRWQTLAFGITLMAMALVLMIRTDLIEQWQSQIPANTPNHFVMNILPTDTQPFQQFLTEHNITPSTLYPVSRGRLTHINGSAVKQAVTKEEENNEALNRELNLTEASHMQPENKIVEGEWWDTADESSSPRVSIESRLAKRLNINLNDNLTFFIGSRTLEVTVTSIRSVKWDSFRPNFYIIFEPDSLSGFPQTLLTSFYLPTEQRTVLNNLLRQFPAITLLEVEAILTQIKTTLTQVTLAVELVLSFVLLAGFSVTFAALRSSMSQRLLEGALMRTLGANRRQIRANQWVEYSLMGALAGLIASFGAESIMYVAYTHIFGLEYSFNPVLTIVLILIGAASISVFGGLSGRRVLKNSPAIVLRDM
ncbi:hypothetical protein A9Q99_19985 [Gammaproteobacteria bacterium 45_16_T64]|nr:hypothetical protein A9Q99_19985 [Gammaproteobacteria bacterium 45_16_T64]